MDGWQVQIIQCTMRNELAKYLDGDARTGAFLRPMKLKPFDRPTGEARRESS